MFEMRRTLAAAAIGAAALGATVFAPVAGAEMKHEGVTVNILTRPGPVIAGRLEERGEEFKEMTGATINVSSVPFADLFQKLLTDWSTGTNSIDVGVFASGWAVELADSDLLADLSDFVANDPDIMFDDIAPYFREFNQKIDGKTYLITVDGDFHMLYYRTDVLEKNGLEPPDTWDEYLEVAAAVHGQDMNGDGEPDYGSCLFKKRNEQSFWLPLSIAGGFLQTQGTGQGIFFDTETMEPLVRNEGFAEALRILKETGKYGPPDELNLAVTDTRPYVLSGRCALLLEWGDIGPLSIDLEQSKIKGLVASKILPGSTRVVDRATGKLVDCTPELCPHAIDGVNHTPFAAFGGWSGAVNAKADPKVIAAAYDFLSYMNAPAQSNYDVTLGWTGYDPYRISQFENVQLWVDQGFSKEGAENYLGAIKQSLNSPNMASDLRIPGTQQYEGICLDREIARFLADEISAEETMDNIYECWEEVTEDFGRERQGELYRASLGITN
jgi:multiple sugar transport system substrate-binding protein